MILLVTNFQTENKFFTFSNLNPLRENSINNLNIFVICWSGLHGNQYQIKERYLGEPEKDGGTGGEICIRTQDIGEENLGDLYLVPEIKGFKQN